MICAYPWKPQPVQAPHLEYACGRCRPCRINRRDELVTRMRLESQHHRSSVFVTLTYDDAHLPPENNLEPKDLTDYWKRLRSTGLRFRYFAAGEYGRLGRPHYHAILFGPDLTATDAIHGAWGRGFTSTRPVLDGAYAYVGKYLFKDSRDYAEKTQPFARWSSKPPLGAYAMDSWGEDFKRRKLAIRSLPRQDVPNVVRFTDGTKPIGRTLTRRLRLAATGSPDASRAAEAARNARLDSRTPVDFFIRERARKNGEARADRLYTSVKGKRTL